MFRSGLRKRHRALCVTTVTILCILVFWMFVIQNDLHQHLPIALTEYVCPAPHSRLPQLLLDLHAVVVQLQRTPGLNEEWSKGMEDQLVGILRQFDRKYEPPPRLSDAQLSVVNRLPYLDYCPREFVHVSLAAPFYLSGSWLPSQACPNVRRLEDIVSILIYWNKKGPKCVKRLEHLLYAIKRTHPSMRVYVAIDFGACTWENSYETSIVEVTNVDNTWRPGQIWNKLAGQVKTPYVLVARGLEDFSWLTQVRRQVSILSTEPLVHVVSGSVRNATGHWQVGCSQSYLYNYILEYRDGYFSSKNECMFCDHVVGPFVARTPTVQTVLFDEGLSSSILFEDWFLRLKIGSKLVMNCPDALYFATDPSINDKLVQRKSWLTLVNKWQINRLVLPEEVKMSFSCAESRLECTEMYMLTRRQMMPICCMDQFANALHTFHELCVTNGLLYNYIGGTTLGAVKFRGFIPWDFDGDGEYYAANLTFFQHWGTEQKKKGKGAFVDSVDEKAPGYFRLRTPEMFVEMWAMNKTASDLVMPDLFKKIPTKMRIHGVWVYGPPSPGLHARNIYGKEALQHSSSWYHTGKKDWTDPYNVRRHFVPCENYGHHACASQFKTDGSFQFTIP